MSKKVLVISTSLRRDSNSHDLAMEFAKGAQSGENTVEVISLEGKNIGFCIGCLACQKTGKCVIEDDVEQIADKIIQADVVAFATPIYFYEMAGQMKTLLDRLNPIFPKDYRFRDIYLIGAAADGNESAVDGAIKGLQGFVGCFDKARLAGALRGVGLTNGGEVQGDKNADLRKKAFDMGKSV